MNSRILLILNCLLIGFSQALVSQANDTLRPILNLRGPGDFVDNFNDYTGLEFPESSLSYLQEQLQALDSASHESFLLAPYPLLPQSPEIDDELIDTYFDGITSEKGYLVYTLYEDGDITNPRFLVKVKNPDIGQGEIPGIEQDIANAMRNHSGSGLAYPDKLAAGIERYLHIINWDADFTPFYSGALAPLEDDEILYPSFELGEAATFIAVSGVPITLPEGTRVKFMNKESDRGGLLHSFLPPGSPQFYTPMSWAQGDHAGKFAGYGYWEPAPPGSGSQIKVQFYSYQGFNQGNPCGGAPPYVEDEMVSVLLGYLTGCPQRGQLYVFPRLYRAHWKDLTDPTPFTPGYPAYRAANSLQTFDAVSNYFINDVQAWDTICSESRSITPNALQKEIPFPCGILQKMAPLSALAAGQYAYIYFENGTEAVMTRYGSNLYLSYVDSDGQMAILAHDQYYGWYYTDLQAPQFSADVNIILDWAGELALDVGITTAFIAINIPLGGAAAAMAAPYGVELGAILLVDLTLSAAEAGVVYMVKDDSNLALQTFAAGAVGAAGGTLLTNAVKGYRYSRSLGYSDDLDAMLKFNRHTGIPGSNGPPLKKSLKAFQEDALGHGLNEGQVDELLGDMEADDELARYLMTDEGRVRAWERLNPHPNRTSLPILTRRVEFDDLPLHWRKENPYTNQDMFDPNSGGYTVAHTGHNDYPHEYDMADAIAKDGKAVKLRDESTPDPAFGNKTPDADIDGVVHDFKNFDSPNNVNGKVYNHIISSGSRSNAPGVTFNLRGNSASLDDVNQGLDDVRELIANEGVPSGMAEQVGLVYSDGTVAFLSKNEIINGAYF